MVTIYIAREMIFPRTTNAVPGVTVFAQAQTGQMGFALAEPLWNALIADGFIYDRRDNALVRPISSDARISVLRRSLSPYTALLRFSEGAPEALLRDIAANNNGRRINGTRARHGLSPLPTPVLPPWYVALESGQILESATIVEMTAVVSSAQFWGSSDRQEHFVVPPQYADEEVSRVQEVARKFSASVAFCNHVSQAPSW